MKAHLFGCIVISLLLAACQSPIPAGEIINQKASLPAFFELNQMGVITSSINKRQHTMSVLYGNAVSVKRARSGAAIQPNEQLLLVTWKQKPDENWFGANIPNQVQSVEKVTTGVAANETSYWRYEGTSFSVSRDTTANYSRINAIFDMQASVMP